MQARQLAAELVTIVKQLLELNVKMRKLKVDLQLELHCRNFLIYIISHCCTFTQQGIFRTIQLPMSPPYWVHDSAAVQADEEDLNPPELNDLYPSKLSFFVASMLLDNFMQQQALLSLDNTVERLEVEIEVLGNTLKYMSARFALQGAFKPADTEAEGDKPSSTPGPD